jgi:hypothetical protein
VLAETPDGLNTLFIIFISVLAKSQIELLVSPGIEPGYIVFPSQNNNGILCPWSVLQIHVGIENF